ncbi:MAG TPA: tetratricopeptide repeat protein, partial [Flexilinea sp.]|nr:tetratricopeptide repeat protein [Flexilinea sp.]
SEAITAFERARSLNPYDSWAPYYISRTYSGNGEYAKAIQQAQDAIDLDPTNAMFYWNLGTQYYMSEDYANALTYFRLAIQGGTTPNGEIIEGIPLSYDNRVPELYYMYGIILARSGNCQEAAEIVKLITQGIPNDTIAVENAQYMTDICKSGTFDITLTTPTAPAPAE